MVRRRACLTTNLFLNVISAKQNHLVQKNLYFTTKLPRFSKNLRLFFKKFNHLYKIFNVRPHFKYFSKASYNIIKVFKVEILNLLFKLPFFTKTSFIKLLNNNLFLNFHTKIKYLSYNNYTVLIRTKVLPILIKHLLFSIVKICLLIYNSFYKTLPQLFLTNVINYVFAKKHLY